MRIKIYQINSDRDNNNVKFFGYDSLQKLQGSTDIDSGIYKNVFYGDVDGDDLEDIYAIFNMDRVPTLQGHNLSVSDVVEVIDCDNEIFILLIVCIVLICKSCTDNHDLTTLQGAWHYDEYTEYEFDGKGNGCMCLDEENHFEFTYSVEGDTVKLDFVLDYVTDCEYTFAVEGDTLTLIGGEGTVGGTYELAKVNE